MIDTLFFVLQIIGFIVIVAWAVVHDRVRAGGPTGGPLAFKPGGGDGAKPVSERRRRTGLTRRHGSANLKDQRR